MFDKENRMSEKIKRVNFRKQLDVFARQLENNGASDFSRLEWITLVLFANWLDKKYTDRIMRQVSRKEEAE